MPLPQVSGVNDVKVDKDPPVSEPAVVTESGEFVALYIPMLPEAHVCKDDADDCKRMR